MRTHLVDILIFCTLAYAAWSGWKRGVILEVLNTLGLLVGIVVGFMLYDVVAGLLGPYVGIQGWWLKVFAFGLTALLVFRVWLWLSKMASNSFRVTALGMADQGLGVCVGLLKASLMLSAFFWLAGLLNLKTVRTQVAESALAADVVKLGNAEFTLMSKATPLFVKWYGMARASAFHIDRPSRIDDGHS